MTFMRYLGGKARIARWLVENIVPLGGECYVEPFLGGANSFEKLAPYWKSCRASDSHEDLVLMWNALAAGWDPPERVTREEYETLKSAEPSALRGFVGFGSSWSGKWFGGYVDAPYDRANDYVMPHFAATARRAVLKASAVVGTALDGVQLLDYRDLKPEPDFLIYCDPPYLETTPYGGTNFSPDEFWDTATEWHRQGACVVVSESVAPRGWKILAEKDRKHMLKAVRGQEQQFRHERLYVLT